MVARPVTHFKEKEREEKSMFDMVEGWIIFRGWRVAKVATHVPPHIKSELEAELKKAERREPKFTSNYELARHNSHFAHENRDKEA